MSLYRKYRPQTFDDLVGQEHIAQTLRNALSAQPLRVAHAYLFVGPRGTGKTTSARLLAKCLNCAQGPTSTPCNECDFCTRVRDNQPTMDLVEIDAASHTGVDNVREVIIDKVNTAPAQGRYRIYIIDEVHMLSTSSFNALLKTLEEPPAHAIFVLATTDVHKVPPTISSRCQRFDFRRVGPSDIVGRLQYVAGHEGINLSDGAARLIAHQADGALRDSLTLLEQVTAFSAEIIDEADVRLVLGTVSRELLLSMMDAVAENDPAKALQLVEQATEEGVSFSQLTRDLTSYGRDLMLLTVGFDGNAVLSDEERARRQGHMQAIGRDRLTRVVEMFRAAEKEMRQSTDHRLLLELTLVRLCSNIEPAGASFLAPAATTPLAVPVAPAGQATPRPVWRQPEAQPTAQPTRKAPLPSFPARPTATAPEVPVAPPEYREAEPHDGVPREVAAPSIEDAEPVADGAAPIEVSADASSPVEGDTSSDAAPATSGVRKKGRRIHNLDELIELWPAVLARVKRKIGVTAVAYLHDGLPVAMDDKQAVIEFQKEFHYEKAKEAAGRLPFEQVLNECMATPHRLAFRLAPPQKKVVAVEEDDVPPPPDDDDDIEEDVVRLAQDMFGAQVVGRSGEG